MPVRLYMDQHVPRAITLGLELLRIDVLTAFEDGFSGVIYAHPLRVSIGGCIRDLSAIAGAGEAEDLTDSVVFLPL